MPSHKDGITMLRVTHFGNRPRVAADFPHGAECTVLATGSKAMARTTEDGGGRRGNRWRMAAWAPHRSRVSVATLVGDAGDNEVVRARPTSLLPAPSWPASTLLTNWQRG